jgi:hypothetical protein
LLCRVVGCAVQLVAEDREVLVEGVADRQRLPRGQTFRFWNRWFSVWFEGRSGQIEALEALLKIPWYRIRPPRSMGECLDIFDERSKICTRSGQFLESEVGLWMYAYTSLP